MTNDDSTVIRHHRSVSTEDIRRREGPFDAAVCAQGPEKLCAQRGEDERGVIANGNRLNGAGKVRPGAKRWLPLCCADIVKGIDASGIAEDIDTAAVRASRLMKK